MPWMPSLRTIVAACATALMIGAPVASAAPADVLSDYQADGGLDSLHSVADLRGALDETADDPANESFRVAVQRQLDQRLLGFERTAPAEPDPSPEQSPLPAPVPRSAPDTGGSDPVLSLTPDALSRANSLPPDAGDVAGLSAVRELPQPPQVASGNEVPLAFLVLSGAAGALMIAGAGSAAFRRVRTHHEARAGAADEEL